MKQEAPPDFNSIADADARRAFLGAGPETVEWLQPGTKLYKWTKSILNPRGITPWWFFVESRVLKNGVRCPGLRERQEYARRLGVSDRDYHRVRAGVTKDWNPMTTATAVTLTAGAWGYIGKAAGQLEDRSIPRVFLIAGDYQVWIPGLGMANIIRISIVPYMMASQGNNSK